MELLFGRYTAQLSKKIWEELEQTFNFRKHIITGDVFNIFIKAIVPLYAQAERVKRNALDKNFAFIDGTVISIARRVHAEVQEIAHNGH